MGRKIKLRSDEDFDLVVKLKDDRHKADKVKTPQQLDMFLNSNGAVANQLYIEGGYDNPLIAYNPDGTRRVNKENVKQAVLDLREEIVNTRFEPKERTQDLIDSNLAYDLETGNPLTRQQKINANNRQYQIRAQALLLAARVGDVDISSYDKGILNKLAEKRYFEAVYGKEDSRGIQRYEKGTFRNKLGFDTGRIRYSDSAGEARAREKADQLLRRGFYAEQF